ALLSAPLHALAGALDSAGEAIPAGVASALFEVLQFVDPLLLAALILFAGLACASATPGAVQTLLVAPRDAVV
ncbi:MAG TPA: hypothetical protein DEA08_05465, partial [Planctomycetes bacterium]|nr:hypothetical protein [Planctomycetota bacterium]